MTFKDIKDEWIKLVNIMNANGVPLPTVRDGKTGKGSISLTLVVLSATLLQIGIIGKYSKILEGIDLNYAMQFFIASCGLYFGRKMQKDDKKISLDEPTQKELETK